MAQTGSQGQQGQQQNQQTGMSQPSGQGLQLSDRDVLQLALNETKHMAGSLNTFVLEASSDQLRRDYMTVLGDVYSQQKQIFDYMQQKGFYNVKNASPQDISQAKQKFSSQSQSGDQSQQMQ